MIVSNRSISTKKVNASKTIPHSPNTFKRKASQMYIIKPELGSQGKGIRLINSFSEIPENSTQNMVVQEYIENPLLIEELKFDLRVYVLVTCCDPLKIFLYNDGLARFATKKYQTLTELNKKHRMMHLTNYSINKKSSKFIFNTDEV